MQTWWVDSLPLSSMIQSDKRRLRRMRISTHVSKYWVCRGNVFSMHTLTEKASCCPSDFVLPLQQWTTSNRWTHTHTTSVGGRAIVMENTNVTWLLWFLKKWFDGNTGQAIHVWQETHTQTHTQMTFRNVNKRWWKDSCCCIDRVWMALDAGA